MIRRHFAELLCDRSHFAALESESQFDNRSGCPIPLQSRTRVLTSRFGTSGYAGSVSPRGENVVGHAGAFEVAALA